MLMLNGLQFKDKSFDSAHTFYRGKAMSQNDVAFSNDAGSISSFRLLQKMIQSDHCRISLDYTVRLVAPIDFVHECAHHTFNNDHYDVNRRLKQPFRMDRIDIPKVIEKLSMPFVLDDSNNNLSAIRFI